MKRWSLSLALAALSLATVGVSHAAKTPEGTLKEFLTAMKKKDRKVLRSSIDWDAMGKSMGMKAESPEQRKTLMERIKIIYVESFALGKSADGFKVSPVTVKGNDAKGSLMRLDPTTKKWIPATQFSMHKNGKNWLITNISGAKS